MPKRKPGPKPKKNLTKTEAAIHELDAKMSAKRTRVSSQDRAFIAFYKEQGFKDPNLAASRALFKDPFCGPRLVVRLFDLIEGERLRSAMEEQMELDEALRITATIARTGEKDADRLTALKLVFQVQGALGDKPLPSTTRQGLAKQVQEMIDRIQTKVVGQPGGNVRIRAALARADNGMGGVIEGAGVEVEMANQPDQGEAIPTTAVRLPLP